MFAFRVAYDGTAFSGFQRQPRVQTIEGALFQALARLEITANAETAPAGYSAAGRTDAGVSAVAQTIVFEAPTWLSPSAINGHLPDTIRAWARAPVPADFHARRHATERAYTYYLHAPDLQTDAIRSILTAFEGTHDFTNFSPDTERTTRRIIDTDARRTDDAIAITIRGDGFCRHQVRRMVSLVEAVASGEREPASIDRLLSSTPVDGPEGVPPAPPEPLLLSAIRYPSLEFESSTTARATVSECFAERVVTLHGRVMVNQHIRDRVRVQGDGEADRSSR